jgi:hypothetical protein
MTPMISFVAAAMRARSMEPLHGLGIALGVVDHSQARRFLLQATQLSANLLVHGLEPVSAYHQARGTLALWQEENASAEVRLKPPSPTFGCPVISLLEIAAEADVSPLIKTG